MPFINCGLKLSNMAVKNYYLVCMVHALSTATFAWDPYVNHANI